MKPALVATLGVGVGVLIGAGVCIPLLSKFQSAPVPDPGPDWKERAAIGTMAGRRSYTLPLNNPDMVPVNEATFMRDDDVILGVLVEGEARAYPWWITSNYHVVNDTVGETPLLITLCEVCGGASAFRPVVPELPRIPLSFQICGVSLGTIEIMDQQTQSKWRPFLGLAFEGPLQGRSLETFPLLVMTWRDWKQRYPKGFVVNGSALLRERPHGAEAGGRIGDPDLPPLFAATANLTDHRLETHELVVGIRDAVLDKSYAIPATQLVPYPNLFLVSLGEKPVLILRDGELAMTAFDLSQTSYRTRFSLSSTNPLSFRTPDGVEWNAFGMATANGGGQTNLPSARSYVTEWYEWVSHSPNTEIIRSPQPIGKPQR